MKLYLILLGAESPGRHVEQHDYFFGVASELKDLVTELRAFWPEAGNSLHIDGWREVTKVDHYVIRVLPKTNESPAARRQLFFLNLGGYTPGLLEEQHYTLLTVQENRKLAIQAAKKKRFFKTNSLKGSATAHIDEKYGLDVDDIHQVEELLAPAIKGSYRLEISEAPELPEDEIHLGYFKLDKLG